MSSTALASDATPPKTKIDCQPKRGSSCRETGPAALTPMP
jgi:hypothetical protein